VGNFRIFIISAVKICKQSLQTSTSTSVAHGLQPVGYTPRAVAPQTKIPGVITVKNKRGNESSLLYSSQGHTDQLHNT